MPNLRDIRNRITSINNTQQITKAMKMVAAAKLRKAQNRMLENRPYAGKLRDVVANLAASEVQGGEAYQTPALSPLLRQPVQTERVLVIVVGSDRGLCGGFNTNLFKAVEQELKGSLAEYHNQGRVDLVCVGRKSVAYFKKRNYSVTGEHPGFFDHLAFDTAADIMKTASTKFEDAVYDAVYIAYNEFKSVISQNRVVEQVLPINPDALTGNSSGKNSSKETGQASGVTGKVSQSVAQFIYEPNPKEILGRLLPLYLNVQFWKAVLESNAAEQGARMAAMDNATENAKELERTLRLKYNQARQSAITTEISEIVSGAAALQG